MHGHRPLAIAFNPQNKISGWSTIVWNYFSPEKNLLKADGGDRGLLDGPPGSATAPGSGQFGWIRLGILTSELDGRIVATDTLS